MTFKRGCIVLVAVLVPQFLKSTDAQRYCLALSPSRMDRSGCGIGPLPPRAALAKLSRSARIETDNSRLVCDLLQLVIIQCNYIVLNFIFEL